MCCIALGPWTTMGIFENSSIVEFNKKTLWRESPFDFETIHIIFLHNKKRYQSQNLSIDQICNQRWWHIWVDNWGLKWSRMSKEVSACYVLCEVALLFATRKFQSWIFGWLEELCAEVISKECNILFVAFVSLSSILCFHNWIFGELRAQAIWKEYSSTQIMCSERKHQGNIFKEQNY